MCGIAGFFGRGTLDDLAGMVRSMYLRGPDDSGFFQDSEQAVFFRA